MTYYLNKTIVLVGLMGAGKTSVGRYLAQDLGCGFADSDERVELRAGMSVKDMFATQGEAAFRAAETQALQEVLQAEPCVLSVGGGAFIAPQNRAMIAARGCSVWLKADVEVLWQRLRGCTDRPLLQEKDGLATLHALAKSRETDYAKADITITAQADWDERYVAARVLAALLVSSKIKELV